MVSACQSQRCGCGISSFPLQKVKALQEKIKDMYKSEQ